MDINTAPGGSGATASELASLLKTKLEKAGKEIGADTLDVLMKDLLVRVDAQMHQAAQDKKVTALNGILAKVSPELLSIIEEGESFAVLHRPAIKDDKGNVTTPAELRVQLDMNEGASRHGSVKLPGDGRKNGERVKVTFLSGPSKGKSEVFSSGRKALEALCKATGKQVPDGHYNAFAFLKRFADAAGATWERVPAEDAKPETPATPEPTPAPEAPAK